MHASISGNSTSGVIYRTKNLYSPIYMVFSDYPHLIKTSKNCLFHSGFGESFSRLMWNNGKFLVWNHIRASVNLKKALKGAPNIRDEHVDLTFHSLIRVNLAVQTLSATNARILNHDLGPDTSETSMFCSLMNTFFDVMNVRNTKEHQIKINPNLKPYETIDNERFDWLKTVFLKYFDDWEANIAQRQGFTKTEKEKMFISKQTRNGLKITVASVIECTR